MSDLGRVEIVFVKSETNEPFELSDEKLFLEREEVELIESLAAAHGLDFEGMFVKILTEGLRSRISGAEDNNNDS